MRLAVSVGGGHRAVARLLAQALQVGRNGSVRIGCMRAAVEAAQRSLALGQQCTSLCCFGFCQRELQDVLLIAEARPPRCAMSRGGWHERGRARRRVGSASGPGAGRLRPTAHVRARALQGGIETGTGQIGAGDRRAALIYGAGWRRSRGMVARREGPWLRAGAMAGRAIVDGHG